MSDKYAGKTLPQCNIKVIFNSKNWLSNLFKFNCSNYNITYYEKAERYLKVSAVEHVSMSTLTKKKGQ